MNQSKLKTFSLIVEFALIEFRFHWWLNEGGNVIQKWKTRLNEEWSLDLIGIQAWMIVVGMKQAKLDWMGFDLQKERNLLPANPLINYFIIEFHSGLIHWLLVWFLSLISIQFINREWMEFQSLNQTNQWIRKWNWRQIKLNSDFSFSINQLQSSSKLSFPFE